MSQYDYRSKEDKIQRMRDRRALIWKMEEEHEAQVPVLTDKQTGADAEGDPPQKSDTPKLYGSDTMQVAAVPDINDYKSYWYGYMTQRFNISPVDPVTAGRLKDTEELDAVMYTAWEKRPDVSTTANPRNNLYNYYLTDEFFYKSQTKIDQAIEDNKKLEPLKEPPPVIVPIKLKSNGEIVWYKINYRIGQMDLSNGIDPPDLDVKFVTAESKIKTVDVNEPRSELKDANDEDVSTQLKQAFAGQEKSGMKPSFIGSFPVPKNKKQKEQLKKIVLNRQNTFFNINENGIVLRNAIYNSLFAFYREKKNNPSPEQENNPGIPHYYGEIFQAGSDKVIVSTVLIEDHRVKKFLFQNISLKYVSNDPVFDTSAMPGTEKDQTDAVMEGIEANDRLRIQMIFENEAPSEEKPQVKAFVMSLIYKQSPVKNIDGSAPIVLSAEDGYTNREFDQVIPIRMQGEPPVIEDVFYTIRIEHSMYNNNQAEHPEQASNMFNIYIERIGRTGEAGKATEDIYALDIRKVQGYPGEGSLAALKTWLKSRYPALITSKKISLDYTSATALISSANKALKASVMDADIPEIIQFLNKNYTTVLHNDKSTIDPVLIGLGYNSPTAEKAKYIGEGDDRKETNETPTETNGVKTVEDETAGIHAWSKEELLLFELSAQQFNKALLSKTLTGKNFFRQQICLRRGFFNKVAGLTLGTAVGYYDSAFADMNKNRFIGGKEQTFDYGQHTILHEIGHLVAHEEVKFTIPNITRPTVEDAFSYFIGKLDKTGMKKSPEATADPYVAPTDYGQKNIHEFYADSFMLYMLDPEFLLTNNPELYWWFDYLQVNATAPETNAILKTIDSKRQAGTLKKRE